MSKLCIAYLALSSWVYGFEKLEPNYLVQYGDPNAEFQAVEYYSFSCSKCLEFFQEEFPAIKKEYIDSGILGFTFHPDPADLLTLQAMVCLDRLPPEKKAFFLEAIMEKMAKLKNPRASSKLMKAAMEVFQDPTPDLEDLEFLKKSQAFQDAFAFVAQEDAIQEIPSIEIDGHLYKKLPSRALIEAHINQKRSS